ncbi:MAG: Ni/Fe hydrogenase subunit alpha [Anaerolineales bacterium]|nr:MAG: Ni/Fe hydrogenase subunit alpha [Anaerolineales bacterium]
MSQTLQIDIHHITRVEGHGNIVVDVRKGKLVKCDLEIVEAPRFFEAMLLGRPYDQASHLTSRICGICAVTHGTASLKAVEKALGVEPSEQTKRLRKLNLFGEMLDSHILHVYLLVAPDLLGVESVISLAQTDIHVVERALRMKKVAGDLCAAICGRHTHPIAMVVGGFTHFPSAEVLESISKRLEAMRTDLDNAVELIQSCQLPAFERETEFIALYTKEEYCFIDGEIMSTEGGPWPLEEYRSITNEHMVDHSTAKHARHQRQSFMVGALARYKLNHDKLHPKAQAAAVALGLTPGCINPYMISVAQVVEIVHCTEGAIDLIQQLLDRGVVSEDPAPVARSSGEGVGACEAPRGTLYHHYEIQDGLVSAANCVIPTAQNLANIEADMRAWVPQQLGCTQEEMTMSLEMLVRAYDPCISCSAHMIKVKCV